MNTTARTLCIVHCALCISAASAAIAATPEVTSVTMAQDAQTREVTITYAMDNAPAVVTLDIQTNATVNGETVWASIGGEAVCNATGDVWKKVDASGGTIKWHPDLSWPDHRIPAGGARAVVTAWALDNTPDYLVVNIMATSPTARRTYYPSVDFLPGSELGQKGAITNNPAYKRGYVVMRKIMAKDVVWNMGSVGEGGSNENLHEAQLTNNYYIGVFEFTQGQMQTLNNFYDVPGVSIAPYFTAERQGRPFDMNKMSYIGIRLCYTDGGIGEAGREWPNEPDQHSFLKQLRTRTGVDFDLPSEAEWEFAARAGHGSGYWGDGSPISIADGEDANLNRMARYAKTVTVSSSEVTATTPPAEGGTAIVGSYAPNAWGLYDMYGNVAEFTLDAWSNDPSSLRGMVKKGTSNSTSQTRVYRGGSYASNASGCRPASRGSQAQTVKGKGYGFRVTCRAGLK